jgi:hypothetical protein
MRSQRGALVVQFLVQANGSSLRLTTTDLENFSISQENITPQKMIKLTQDALRAYMKVNQNLEVKKCLIVSQTPNADLTEGQLFEGHIYFS